MNDSFIYRDNMRTTFMFLSNVLDSLRQSSVRLRDCCTITADYFYSSIYQYQSLLSNINDITHDDNNKINSPNIAQIKRDEEKQNARSRLDKVMGKEEECEDEIFGYVDDSHSIEDCLLVRHSEIPENSSTFHKNFYEKLNQACNEGLTISANRNAAIMKQEWMP